MAEAKFLRAVQKATAVDKINSGIIFGEYGTGKTLFCASAIEVVDYSPVLIVDIEGSAAGVGRIFPDVDIVQADTLVKLESIRHELIHGEHPYKTVIFDTLNVAQNRKEAEIRARVNDTFAVYRELAPWTINFVREQHHAPYMALFIAHPKTDRDDNTGRTITTFKLAGSARDEVPTIPDFIGYMGYEDDEDGKTQRCLRVGKHPSIVTKNRFGLEERILSPSIAKVQYAILEEKEKD